VTKRKILVAGAGGFIGGWLVKELLNDLDNQVISVDIKPLSEWYQTFEGTPGIVADLRDNRITDQLVEGVDVIYNLAADMGGMGFIENNKALCMMSVSINTNLLDSARRYQVQEYFYASSACVYNQMLQKDSNNLGLRESDAYPADPEDGYGWEKLFSERMARHFYEDFGIETRIARFHNVYGPHGTFQGGREKAPAAISRKIALAKLSGKHEIEIWGDGEQSRSFTYIDDTINGIKLLMGSEFRDPLNLGSSEMVTINQLVEIIEDIASIKVKRNYNLAAPLGVRGRNSDNTLIKELFDWEPGVKLYEGLTTTYNWIYDELSKS
jgi:nucleoside-diphosphate-sugar epimerase